MAEFLTTSGVSYRIEDIIRNAKQSVVLVSPYLQFSKNFFERLKDAESHNVNITIVFGKNQLQAKEGEQLATLKKLSLYFSENLHAKCYFNESEMVITSMNMYEYSEKNNREMGIFITKSNDETLYKQAAIETESIIKASEIVKIGNGKAKKTANKPYASKAKFKDPQVNPGFCIRCEDEIPFDLDRPYCWNCFNTWSQFGNTFYEEAVCHNCGNDNNSTMVKPVCYRCYKSM